MIDDPLSNPLLDDDPDNCGIDESTEILDFSKQDDEWHRIESVTFDSSQVFGEKIAIPQTLHYLITQMDLNIARPPSLGNPSTRLEWLEMHLNENGTIKRSGSLERQDLFDFFELCNDQLSRFWKDDQRVQVVKMTIQLSKMLAPERFTTLYPTIYFLVTDVISYFGRLVYDRLVSKCPDLKINFTYNEVSPQAKELCKNWLYKIASIRELVPRFYLEISILKSYRFSFETTGYPALLERLTNMVRGFGEPISAAYARYVKFGLFVNLNCEN